MDEYTTNSHYLIRTFLFKSLGECAFWTWEWKSWTERALLLWFSAFSRFWSAWIRICNVVSLISWALVVVFPRPLLFCRINPRVVRFTDMVILVVSIMNRHMHTDRMKDRCTVYTNRWNHERASTIIFWYFNIKIHQSLRVTAVF